MTPELSPSGVPQSATDVLVGYYTEAAEKLRQLVLHPKGVSESSKDFNQARASMLLNQIDHAMQELKVEAAGWIGPNISQAMIDGITRANRQLDNMGLLPEGTPIVGSFSQIDEGTLKLLATDTYRDLVTKAADSLGANARTALRRTSQRNISEAQINQILAGGVIHGMPAETIRTLRDSLARVNNGVVTIRDKNGEDRDFDAGKYARMVVRTKTREATTKSRHERLLSEGVTRVSIVGLVSKTFCTAYLGMVFSIEKGDDKYPALAELPSGGPPFHPNCSKSTRAFVAELANEKQLDDADGLTSDPEKFLNVDSATAQKRFQMLQGHAEVKAKYASTAKELFGKVSN